MNAGGFRIGVTAILATLVAACGFHPLYGRLGANPGAQRIFASIYVQPIETERVGYELRNNLMDLLDARSNSANARYRLNVKLDEARNSVAVQNEVIAGVSTTTITRYNYTLKATYQLVDAQTGKVVTSGQQNSLSAYNVTNSYATLIAQQDAQKRAAEDIAYRIRLNLGVFFAQNQSRAS